MTAFQLVGGTPWGPEPAPRGRVLLEKLSEACFVQGLMEEVRGAGGIGRALVLEDLEDWLRSLDLILRAAGPGGVWSGWCRQAGPSHSTPAPLPHVSGRDRVSPSTLRKGHFSP